MAPSTRRRSHRLPPMLCSPPLSASPPAAGSWASCGARCGRRCSPPSTACPSSSPDGWCGCCRRRTQPPQQQTPRLPRARRRRRRRPAAAAAAARGPSESSSTLRGWGARSSSSSSSSRRRAAAAEQEQVQEEEAVSTWLMCCATAQTRRWRTPRRPSGERAGAACRFFSFAAACWACRAAPPAPCLPAVPRPHLLPLHALPPSPSPGSLLPPQASGASGPLCQGQQPRSHPSGAQRAGGPQLAALVHPSGPADAGKQGNKTIGSVIKQIQSYVDCYHILQPAHAGKLGGAARRPPQPLPPSCSCISGKPRAGAP